MVDDNHGDDHDDGAPPWGPGGPRCCFDLTAISERATKPPNPIKWNSIKIFEEEAHIKLSKTTLDNSLTMVWFYVLTYQHRKVLLAD